MKEQTQYLKTEISTLQSEVSGDYILPDSYPDVKNILSCSARICDVKKYFGANEVEISGNFAYNIMFSAADDNGGDVICSVSFTDDFKTVCRYKYASNVGAGTQTKLRELNCRMANPRKFSIKASLETLMFEDITASAYPTLPPDMPANADMQYKWGESTVCRCRSASLCEHSFSDNIELDMKLPEIAEIVHYDTVLNVRDERSTDVKDSPMKLGGVFTVNLVYKDKEGACHGINRDIPFGITINDDESAMIGDTSDPSVSIVPAVYISAVNLNVGKNQYDEAKVLEFDADYDIDLLVMSSENIKYVTDAYSTKYDCECKYELQSMLTPVARIKNNFTYTDSREKSELGLEDTLLLAHAIPTIADVHTEKNGSYINIVGKICEKTALMHDENRVKGKDIIMPFTYKSSVSASDDGIGMIGSAMLMDNRTRSDSERMYTDAEMYLDYLLTEKENATLCKSVTLNTESCTKPGRELFCVYYPTQGESIWDTAKKKKTTVEKILTLNPGIDVSSGAPIIVE